MFLPVKDPDLEALDYRECSELIPMAMVSCERVRKQDLGRRDDAVTLE